MNDREGLSSRKKQEGEIISRLDKRIGHKK